MEWIPYRDHLELFISLAKDKTVHRKLKKVYDNLKDRMLYYPAAVKYHHPWSGGWGDHTAQVMYLGCYLFDILEPTSSPAFSRDDVLTVCFVHDLDKLWRYEKNDDEKDLKKGIEFKYKPHAGYEDTSKAIAECFRNGLELTDVHIEAINHHHGGFSLDIASIFNRGSKMTSLSVLVHSADFLSTMFWGDKKPEVVASCSFCKGSGTDPEHKRFCRKCGGIGKVANNLKAPVA